MSSECKVRNHTLASRLPCGAGQGQVRPLFSNPKPTFSSRIRISSPAKEGPSALALSQQEQQRPHQRHGGLAA